MISVVMSIYKTKKEYILEAVESILNQTYSNFEFIIINNGSDKQIDNLLLSFNDKRIIILRTEEVVTLYESRTIGIKSSKNDWVALMDADDISLPERFSSQLSFLKENSDLKIGCIGTYARYLNEKSEVIGHRISRPTSVSEHEEMRVSHEAIITTDPSAIINKNVFLEAGGYRADYSPAADLDLWYRVVEKGYLVLTLPEYYFYYRIHKDADSTSKFMLQRKKIHFANMNMERRRKNLLEIDYEHFCNKYWSSFSYKFPRMWRNYAKYYYKKAGLSYLNKNYIGVIFFLIPAVLFNPFYVINRVLSHKFKAKSL